MNVHSTKFKIFWSVLIILVGLNIWLLYGKLNLQQEVNRLQVESLKKAGITSTTTEPINFSGPELAVAKPLKMIAIFTDYGCGSCVISEIKHLNDWSRNYPNALQIFYQGATNNYLEEVGAEFEYQEVESARDLFNVTMPVGNPIAVIVDENNTAQILHTNDLSRLGSDRRRTNFYKQAESLFASVYGE